MGGNFFRNYFVFRYVPIFFEGFKRQVPGNRVTPRGSKSSGTGSCRPEGRKDGSYSRPSNWGGELASERASQLAGLSSSGSGGFLKERTKQSCSDLSPRGVERGPGSCQGRPQRKKLCLRRVGRRLNRAFLLVRLACAGIRIKKNRRGGRYESHRRLSPGAAAITLSR